MLTCLFACMLMYNNLKCVHAGIHACIHTFLHAYLCIFLCDMHANYTHAFLEKPHCKIEYRRGHTAENFQFLIYRS